MSTVFVALFWLIFVADKALRREPHVLLRGFCSQHKGVLLIIIIVILILFLFLVFVFVLPVCFILFFYYEGRWEINFSWFEIEKSQ